MRRKNQEMTIMGGSIQHYIIYFKPDYTFHLVSEDFAIEGYQ
jgi:hypothetical protein